MSPEAADGLKQLTRYRAHLVEERTSLKDLATVLAGRLFPELATVLPGGMQSRAFGAAIGEYGDPRTVAAIDVRTLERTLREASRGHLGRAEARAVKDAARSSVGVPYASGALAFEARRVVGLMERLDEEISDIEAECARAMRETGADVIQTIPGIGPVNAAVIAAELGDPDRSGGAKEVIAFAGIDASRVQSGNFEGTESHMPKRGVVPPGMLASHGRRRGPEARPLLRGLLRIHAREGQAPLRGALGRGQEACGHHPGGVERGPVLREAGAGGAQVEMPASE